MKIKAIITGSTGMVGEGVLHECLKHPDVTKVIVINRRPCGVQHDKLEEIIHTDFFDFSSIKERLRGYNACYFCMGVSSVGMNEEKYHHLTYDITSALSNVLAEMGGDATFCYISGAGTDSTEKGRSMWARVKGKTENHVMALFANGYAFRPGYIQPIKGLKNTYKVYKFIAPFYPVLKTLFPGAVCTLEDIGLSMIHVTQTAHDPRILECRDITRIAHEE
ncbi:MAG: epimerase [Bacteroidetes bacterium]|nr:MAG: epimerase [Bacteroidota bacterium]